MAGSLPSLQPKKQSESASTVVQHGVPMRSYDQGGPVYSLAEFSKKRQREWAEFFDRHRSSATPSFCGPDIWTAWFFANSQYQPRVFEKRNAYGELEALLPMYQKGSQLCVACDICVDYQDIIADSIASAVELLKEIVSYCERYSLRLVLAKVSEKSFLYQVLQEPGIRKQANWVNRYWSTCWAASFAKAEGDEFLPACFSSKNRRRFGQKRRRLQKALREVEIRFLTGNEITASLLSEVAQLHWDNQHRRRGESIFSESQFALFLELQAKVTDDLFISTMRSEQGGDLISFVIGYFDQDTFFYYLTSYDGEFSHLSPGLCLLLESLEHCYDKIQGDNLEFDLLSGSEWYKKRWAAPSYKVIRYMGFPKTVMFLPAFGWFSALYAGKKLKNRFVLEKFRKIRLSGKKH